MTLVLAFGLVALTSLGLAVLPWLDGALDDTVASASEAAPGLLVKSGVVGARPLQN